MEFCCTFSKVKIKILETAELKPADFNDLTEVCRFFVSLFLAGMGFHTFLTLFLNHGVASTFHVCGCEALKGDRKFQNKSLQQHKDSLKKF